MTEPGHSAVFSPVCSWYQDTHTGENTPLWPGSVNRAHLAHVIDDGAGPQRGVLAGVRVLVPAAAAAGLPNRARHVVAKIGGEMLLRFGTNLHGADVSFAHEPQAFDHVADLRLDHEHDGIVAQAGVGAEENEEIGEAADADAEIGAQAVAPGIVDLGPPRPKSFIP